MAGCGHLTKSDFLSRTADVFGKAGQETPAGRYGQEVQPLFDQPYIDPLTEYLQQHEGDPERKAQLEHVRVERERRCAVVAHRYNTDEISETGLALYRRGYSFSCPADVAAYKARLDALETSPEPARKPVKSRSALAASETVQSEGDTRPAADRQKGTVSRQLNDCYLLTRIRNFSAALDACRGPAEDGVTGAQVNMARIQKALGNHEASYRWAREAAPVSGQAAYLLGDMYANGRGVAQDKDAATQWFNTAIELGYTEARSARDNIAAADSRDH